MNEQPLDHTFQEPIPVGKGLRLVNFVIDTIACYAVAFLLLKILMLIFGSITVKAMWGWIAMLIMPSTLLYYVVFEHFWGKTIGKLLTGTQVLTEDGDKPTLGKIFRRNLARLLPLNPISFLMNETGWHDSMTGTVVVKG
jgi:uncharacterized RDD family membrane protein YckC